MEHTDYIDEEDGGVGELENLLVRLEIPVSMRGQRMDKVLSQLLPEYSRSRIQSWIEQGLALRNDQPINSKEPAWGGETIHLTKLKDPSENSFLAEPVPLDVIYDDVSIVVINKPAGLVVHPAAGNWEGTLLNGVLYHFPQCAHVPRAGIVHRLDKDTSGLLVVAKTLEAQTDLVRQLQARSVNRLYLALVWGKFPPSKTLREPIGRDSRDRLRMAVLQGDAGKPAVTHVKCLGHFESHGAALSLVVCKLETGRTHQIRVHMENAGFPLFNDPIYKRASSGEALKKMKESLGENFSLSGQALHATLLGFIHPQTKDYRSWQVSPPLPLLKIFDYLGIPHEIWKDLVQGQEGGFFE